MKLEKWKFVINVIQLILNIITVIGAVYILFSSLYDMADVGFRKVMLNFTYFIFIGSSLLINLITFVLIFFYIFKKGNKKNNSFIKYTLSNIFWYICIGFIGFLIGDSILILDTMYFGTFETYPLVKYIFLLVFIIGFIIIFMKFNYKVYYTDYSKLNISSNFLNKFSSNIIVIMILLSILFHTTGKENINILKEYEVVQETKQQKELEEEKLKLELIRKSIELLDKLNRTLDNSEN